MQITFQSPALHSSTATPLAKPLLQAFEQQARTRKEKTESCFERRSLKRGALSDRATRKDTRSDRTLTQAHNLSLHSAVLNHSTVINANHSTLFNKATPFLEVNPKKSIFLKTLRQSKFQKTRLVNPFQKQPAIELKGHAKPLQSRLKELVKMR